MGLSHYCRHFSLELAGRRNRARRHAPHRLSAFRSKFQNASRRILLAETTLALPLLLFGTFALAPANAQQLAVHAEAIGPAGSNPIVIYNSGSLNGGTPSSSAVPSLSLIGITADGPTGTNIIIINSGFISAKWRAIDTAWAATEIENSGVILGAIDLTGANDTFINRPGGLFAARGVSDFIFGNDLFRNENGGTVETASNPNLNETTAFIGLERFENAGLITLQDGGEGDVFRITSDTPGATPGAGFAYSASGKSTLAVDAFLGGPGSKADNFIVDGNVSGKTLVTVNNTNPGPGQFNPGIPVVFVNGNVSSNAFFLPKPVETGLFAYDLFPTDSTIFELKSFPGANAHILPQLLTANQDIWWATSNTWLDRTADLRVILNHAAPAPSPDDRYVGPNLNPSVLTPAVWVRAGGASLDRDDTENVKAFGRNFDYNLNRTLELANFQAGVDFGKRALFSDHDALVFGFLGGAVLADLDYDAQMEQFRIDGGEVGTYATYLSGGLFVDTLFDAQFLNIDPQGTSGFPGSLDDTKLGVRTDTGYRFGGFNGGFFFEPLATIGVVWSDIHSFSREGNTVNFDDNANVRGRLGLRIGTSYQVWQGTVMEPFVIGSVWSHLSGDNEVTLISNGSTFHLEDNPQDTWGEVSSGVNFFNPGVHTTAFVKVDFAFGDDMDGVGGKVGMRYNW
jgi:outer membrane autotransporter protein